MMPYQMIAGGTFTVPVSGGVASAVNVECQSQNPPDFIIARNIAGLTTGANDFTKGWGQSGAARAIEWFWQRAMPQYSAKGILQSSEASTPQLPAMTAYTISANGISHYDTATPPTFSALTATAINRTTFVVSMTNTGTIAVGDYVRLFNTFAELQIGGYTFQVTAVTTNTSITLGYMATSGMVFAADATTGIQVVKIIPGRMYPRWAYIANITKAPQAKVYFTAKNDFTPGEIVSFRVPDISPTETTMTQINNVPARVLSVINSATESSIVIDLDTSGFTTFAFATSATAASGVSPSVVVPSSSGVVPDNGSATIAQQPPGTNLRDAFDNRNVRLITFGAGCFNVSGHVSVDGDLWDWAAFKYDTYNQQ